MSYSKRIDAALVPLPGRVSFWRCLPQFFCAPLHGQPLLYMALLAGCSFLVPALPIPSPFDLLIVHAGIWLAFLGYAYGVFQQAAVRPPTPPVHPAGEGVRAGFLSCLGLCGFIFLLSVAASQLLQVVEPILPEWLVLPGINFVLMYFTLTMINLMGYVLRQYRHEPGGSVVVPVNDKRKEDSPEDEVGEVIASLVAEGKLEQALEIASAHRCQDAENDQAQERYIKLLLLANKRERFLNQGRQMISRRLRRGRGDSALDAYLRCLAEDPQFAPEQGKEVLQLAEAARQRRDYATALSLVKGFDRRYPRDPDIPAIYFFSAQVLCEHYRQDDSARKLLEVLLERYPSHPLCPEVERYLATLQCQPVVQAGV